MKEGRKEGDLTERRKDVKGREDGRKIKEGRKDRS